MAINTSPMFRAAQALTADQLRSMLALRDNGPQSRTQTGDAGGASEAVNQWSMPGKFGAVITRDPATGKTLIYQARNASTWGGNDTSDVWDEQGNYLGTSSGESELGGFARHVVLPAIGGAVASQYAGAANAGSASASAAAPTATVSAESLGAIQGLSDLGMGGMSTAATSAALPTAAVGAETLGAIPGLAELGTSIAPVASGTGAATAAGTGAAGLSSLDKAAMYGADAYGAGMTGAQTSVFDGVLGATGSTTLANVAASNPSVAAGLDTLASGATTAAKTLAGNGGADAGTLTTKNWVDLAKAGVTAGSLLAGSGGDGSDGAQARANSVSDAQLQGMQFALDQARELSDYNRSTFRPVEQRMADSALNYDTEGRRESAAQEATGRVATEFDQTRQQAQKDMIRAGMDPSTIQALGTSSLIDEAKARAGAANTARSTIENQGWARMADVANLGRNIASNQATQQQIGINAGNSSANNSVNAAKLKQADDAAMIQGVGQIANYVGGLFASSDKTKKRGTGKMADAAKSLKEIEATPVHEGWTYKDDPTQTNHTGPMAQDVNRISGEQAAPGGKVIDLVNQQGRMMAAIKALSKDVKALKREDSKEAA